MYSETIKPKLTNRFHLSTYINFKACKFKSSKCTHRIIIYRIPNKIYQFFLNELEQENSSEIDFYFSEWYIINSFDVRRTNKGKNKGKYKTSIMNRNQIGHNFPENSNKTKKINHVRTGENEVWMIYVCRDILCCK